MATDIELPTPVANGSIEDAQNFVNSLPGNMTPEQRQSIAQSNPGWHAPAAAAPDFIPYKPPVDPHAGSSGRTPSFTPPAKVQGLVTPGNIDLGNRPILHNPDGSISSERSFSIGTDQGEVLIPRIFDGKDHTEKEAIEHYKQTGQHMGIFDTPDHADAYATAIHNRAIPANDSPDFIPFGNSKPKEEPGSLETGWSWAKAAYNDVGHAAQGLHDFADHIMGYKVSPAAKVHLSRAYSALKDGNAAEAQFHLRNAAQDFVENHPASEAIAEQWNSSARNLQAAKDAMKSGDHLSTIQHMAGVAPIANVVSDAFDKAIKEPTQQNIVHAAIAGALAASPAMIKGAKAMLPESEAGEAAAAVKPAEATPELSANESAVQKSLKKVELEPGTEATPETVTKTPATVVKTPGIPAEAPPTGTMHEPILQNSVRSQVNQVLKDEGLNPVDSSVDLRDVGDQASKQFFARSQEGFGAIREATGKDLNAARQELNDLYRKKAQTFDPDTEDRLVEKIQRVEEEVDATFAQAKEQGVAVEKPMQDWIKSKAISEWGETVRHSVDPLNKTGTFDPGKYTPRLEKIYRSDPRYPGKFDEATGKLNESPSRLEQAFGKSAAEKMRDDAFAASDTQRFLKDYKPEPGTPDTVTKTPASETRTPAMPATEAKAMYDLVRKNTGRQFGVGRESTNWGKVYKDFDSLTPAERAARFKNPAAVESTILKQARRQFAKRAGAAIGVAAVAHVFDLDKHLAAKIASLL